MDEDPSEDDRQLEHELGPGLQEALDGTQVRALLRPPTVTSGADHPAKLRGNFENENEKILVPVERTRLGSRDESRVVKELSSMNKVPAVPPISWNLN